MTKNPGYMKGPSLITPKGSKRRRVQLICQEESKTEQSHVAACDINNIMKRATPQPQVSTIMNPANYGDFSEVGSFEDAITKVRQVTNEFNALPAGLRAKFDNDPMKLITFLQNPDNKDEAVKIGLVKGPDPVNVGQPVKMPENAAGATEGTEYTSPPGNTPDEA